MHSARNKPVIALTGSAGVPPAMSAKREKAFQKSDFKDCSPAARCGRDARAPSVSRLW